MLPVDHEKYQIIVTRTIMYILVEIFMLQIRHLIIRTIKSIIYFQETQGWL